MTHTIQPTDKRRRKGFGGKYFAKDAQKTRQKFFRIAPEIRSEDMHRRFAVSKLVSADCERIGIEQFEELAAYAEAERLGCWVLWEHEGNEVGNWWVRHSVRTGKNEWLRIGGASENRRLKIVSERFAQIEILREAPPRSGLR